MKIGQAENMHRKYDFLVAGFLKEGESVLEIHLHSPVKYIEECCEKSRTKGSPECMRELRISGKSGSGLEQ
ncbi:glycosyl hydrolase 2 galactose-binding domain-containing protein [Parablautia intestinalis]